MESSYDLDRFVDAQANCIDAALCELREGQKRSHWMWFVFPQIAGLGFSLTSRRYSIVDVGEARCYLEHPVLGPRLIECTNVVLDVERRTAREIFGLPDVLKFRSSMTLFECVSDDDHPFATALDKYYDGQRDERTLELLGS